MQIPVNMYINKIQRKARTETVSEMFNIIIGNDLANYRTTLHFSHIANSKVKFHFMALKAKLKRNICQSNGI